MSVCMFESPISSFHKIFLPLDDFICDFFGGVSLWQAVHQQSYINLRMSLGVLCIRSYTIIIWELLLSLFRFLPKHDLENFILNPILWIVRPKRLYLFSLFCIFGIKVVFLGGLATYWIEWDNSDLFHQHAKFSVSHNHL